MNQKILVIDDTHLNLNILKDILEAEGFDVYTADNGLGGLNMARLIKPDAILLDVVMQGMDGFETCRCLKHDYSLSNIPVIMESAKTDGNNIKKALELGAFDYVKKPIDPIEVIARIQSALRYKELQDKLKDMAMKDGLTGLYNFSLLIELFGREIRKQQRNKADTSFVMVDIDYFKKVNDTYGHTSGNVVLKELADVLSDSVRAGDIVARFGGEEFGIVLPGAKIQDACSLCERIRSRVENTNFKAGGNNIKITISLGVAAKSYNDSLTMEEIIKKADLRLYEAKTKGRNRVEGC